MDAGVVDVLFTGRLDFGGVVVGEVVFLTAGGLLTLSTFSLIFLATDIREAQEYARMNRGDVRQFSINDSNLATEAQVMDIMKQLNIDTSEGLLYEMIDPRFENYYVGKENVDKIKTALKKEGFSGFKYTDSAQVVGKTTQSIAVIDKSIINQSVEEDIAAAEKSLTNLADEYQQGNTDNAGEMFEQYNKVGVGALKRWVAGKDMTINFSDPKVMTEIKSLLNKEFPSFIKNFYRNKAEASTYMTNIAKRIGPAIAKEGARKGRQVSQDVLTEKGFDPIADKEQDFDQVAKEDRGRKKKYASYLQIVKKTIT